MAQSKTVIANLALSHAGSSKEIADFEEPSEKSQEAKACRRFFSQVQDELLRGFVWPFATKIRSLSLVEEDPNEEWAFSYQYPSDCLFARRILSGTRNETRQTRVPYRIVQGDTGLLLYTDAEDATLEYTLRSEDVLRWPPDFVQAFAFRLAAYIMPRVTGGDPFKLTDRALGLYERSVMAAKAAAVNEQAYEEPPESEFIRGRE
jgi:hypothetical protein